MPKRTDLKKICIIGSGPIVIGQACEFDYSGTQGCKALKEENYTVVLINSNPATIMTDPGIADVTYIEPITPEVVAKIIERERPDALIPTLGGQTALNIAVQLSDEGVLDKFGVELIGARLEVIKKAEDRKLFKESMEKIGLRVPKSKYVYSVEEALSVIDEIGYPAIIRPSFTLGGSGSSIAYNREEFAKQVEWGLTNSLIKEVLIEESVIGWKEYELEVMRDLKDNVVIICSIENFDPMGVHTGDSITVAPAQTLSDKEYQRMRDAAIAIMREIGVETGGSNIQFAVNPENGEMVVIEMNPRVSRSSALASKATGFPIAKIAAKLAVGYTLDEIPNDITKKTPACFEPVIDYCVVKIPRFNFEKFPNTSDVLNTQMKSVGETMAIGRTFKEALQKGMRSLEIGWIGFGVYEDNDLGNKLSSSNIDEIIEKLRYPNSNRLLYLYLALKRGLSIDTIYALTKIDPWFLYNLKEIVEKENEIKRTGLSSCSLLKEAKQFGFSDKQIAIFTGSNEIQVRNIRKQHNILPTFKPVDTCAAEFEAYTPYFYSTYEMENESIPYNNDLGLIDSLCNQNSKKVIVLGSGPNRIGQGIEFDYCCVQSVLAIREEGYEAIMINNNPETVSTDYDISDKLYFEPLTFEDVMNIIELERPLGVIVQFGGQTALKLALPLEKHGVKILGTSPDSIDLAEDRKRFNILCSRLGLPVPPHGTATTYEEALEVAHKLGYPLLVRPSYVLGGRAMEIVYDDEKLAQYIKEAISISEERPVLLDRFLEDAIEVEVDAISDGELTVIGAIMEHIEEAGIHSGDSACVIPPRSLSKNVLELIRSYTYKLTKELKVVGLINIQFAVREDKVFILEVNPRASRTIPFVSKTIGVPLARLATKVMLGKKLSDLNFTSEIEPNYVTVKEAVLPFVKFPGVDIILGPEMKSTGEVMGIDKEFGLAFAKAQMAAGFSLPKSGTVLISVNDEDKPAILPIAKKLVQLGFKLLATKGTALFLTQNGVPCEKVHKVNEGRPNIIDYIISNKINLLINIPLGKKPKRDQTDIRRTALNYGIPYVTTVAGAQAAAEGIASLQRGKITVKSIQEYHSFCSVESITSIA